MRIKLNVQNLEHTEKVYDNVRTQLKNKFTRDNYENSPEREKLI